MKFSLKVALPLLAGVVVFYTSCNKTSNTPAAQTAGADVVSSEVAASLTQSLAGTYGGVNLNSGVTTPSVINDNHTVNTPNSLCGFTADAPLDYDTNTGATRSHTTGRLIFYFNCINGQPAGYFANDSLKTIGTAPGYSFLYDITQNYVIKSLNSKNTLLFVNGNLKSFVDLNYSKPGIKPTSDHTNYVLTGLTVDLSNNNDITSGLATFVSTGSNNYGSWNYVGTIKYLGNHKADVTINGKVYHVTI
jgi:hypothetical protein